MTSTADSSHADYVNELCRKTEARFAGALYVVHDVDEAAALACCGLDATTAGQPTEILHAARGAAQRGCPVVIVQAVDGAVRRFVAEHVPAVDVYDLALPCGVASVAGWLGWSRGVSWDADTTAARGYIIVGEAAERALLAAPATADVPVPFPVDSLPVALREMVVAGAAAQGVDIGFWAVPLLGIVAGCIGATRRVRITAEWGEPCVVWSATIAPSGAGKSPPLRALLKPVRDHDFELHQCTEVALQRHAVELEAWKAAPAEGRGLRPVPPPISAATIDDATMEAISVRLVDNPRGLLAAVDELAGWLNSMDKYRKGGGDEARWLQVHSATSFPIDRKGTANGPARVYVRNPCVSIVGTIQPSIARKHLGNADRRASGACARMLVAAPPVTAAELTERTIPTHVHDNYGRVVRSLFDLRLEEHGDPKDVWLSPAAFSLFRAWHDRNGTACADAARDGDEDAAAMLSKLRGYAPRIALLLALARAAEGGVAAVLGVVDDEDMRGGIAIVDYFEGEARRIYGRWSEDAASERADRERGSLPALAERLAEILRLGPRDREDLRNATGRNVPSVGISAALAILQASGRATMERTVGPRGGRPREVWTLVPGVSA